MHRILKKSSPSVNSLDKLATVAAMLSPTKQLSNEEIMAIHIENLRYDFLKSNPSAKIYCWPAEDAEKYESILSWSIGISLSGTDAFLLLTDDIDEDHLHHIVSELEDTCYLLCPKVTHNKLKRHNQLTLVGITDKDEFCFYFSGRAEKDFTPTFPDMPLYYVHRKNSRT